MTGHEFLPLASAIGIFVLGLGTYWMFGRAH